MLLFSFNNEIKRLQQENSALKEKVEALDKKNQIVEKELREVKNEMEFLKKKSKENNVVVSGVEIKYEDPLQIKEQIQSLTPME
ncbi:hypothetical protein QE152_g30147 [Popillia japonica]|uniref:Uncharacterized protein n=1 Tax=Popillia japonica TaxID=7064 RepID=A0AAW1JFU8_POPJA